MKKKKKGRDQDAGGALDDGDLLDGDVLVGVVLEALDEFGPGLVLLEALVAVALRLDHDVALLGEDALELAEAVLDDDGAALVVAELLVVLPGLPGAAVDLELGPLLPLLLLEALDGLLVLDLVAVALGEPPPVDLALAAVDRDDVVRVGPEPLVGVLALADGLLHGARVELALLGLGPVGAEVVVLLLEERRAEAAAEADGDGGEDGQLVGPALLDDLVVGRRGDREGLVLLAGDVDALEVEEPPAVDGETRQSKGPTSTAPLFPVFDVPLLNASRPLAPPVPTFAVVPGSRVHGAAATTGRPRPREHASPES